MRALLLAGLLLAFPLQQAMPVWAEGYCPSQPGGKCPSPKKKKVTRSRDDFTADQRERLMEEARKICIKRYGAGSRVWKLDYKAWRVTCTEAGY